MSSQDMEDTPNVETGHVLIRKARRPLKPIWKFFDMIPGDSRLAKCKFCNTILKQLI